MRDFISAGLRTDEQHSFNTDDLGGGTTEHEPGGTLRVTIGVPEEFQGRSFNDRLAAAGKETLSTNTGGSYAWNSADGGTVVDNSRDFVDVNTVSNGQTGSILSTARSSTEGNRLSPAQLKPTDFVDIGTMREVPVSLAETLGYLVRDPVTGIYREAGESGSKYLKPTTGSENGFKHPFGGPVKESVQVTEDGMTLDELGNATTPVDGAIQVERVPLGDPKAEGALSALIGGFPNETANEIALAYSGLGEVPEEQIIRTISEGAGLSRDTAELALAGIKHEFSKQAEAAVTALGVPDVEQFSEWARLHHPERFSEAMFQHITQRTPSAYADLAKEFVASLDEVDPEAILEAKMPSGMASWKDTNTNQVMIMLPDGTTHEYRAAVRAGIIKVSARRR